jgi:hypothetical protein
MFVSAIRFTVIQVIKTGILERLGKHLVIQGHITKNTSS